MKLLCIPALAAVLLVSAATADPQRFTAQDLFMTRQLHAQVKLLEERRDRQIAADKEQEIADHRAFEMQAKTTFTAAPGASPHAFNSSLDCYRRRIFGAAKIAAACAGVVDPVDSNQAWKFSSSAGDEAIVTTFKASACYAAWQEVLMPVNRSCHYKSTVIQATSKQYHLENTGKHGKLCVYSAMQMSRTLSCYSYNASSCSAVGAVCKAVPASTIGSVDDATGTVLNVTTDVCTSNFATAALDTWCGTDCVEGYYRAWRKIDPSDFGFGLFQLYDMLICKPRAPSDGGYCYDKFQTLVDQTNGEPFATQAGNKALCSGDVLSCYNRIGSAIFLGGRQSAIDSFKTNMLRQFPEGLPKADNLTHSAYTWSDRYYYNWYISWHQSRIKSTKDQSQRFRAVCSKNVVNEFCVAKYEGLIRSTSGCYAEALRQNATCTTSCQTTLTNYVTGMGCCAGTIHEALSSSAYMEPRDWPTDLPLLGGGYWTPPATEALVPIATSAPLTLNANQALTTRSADKGYFAEMKACVTNLGDKLSIRCARSTKKVSKKLRLLLRWSTLNSTQIEKLKAALKTDMQRSVGCTEDQIVNDQLVEDTTVQVAGRGFEAQSTTGSGTKYEFDLQTDDEATLTAVSNNFDSLDSTSSFDLATTEEANGAVVATESNTTPIPATPTTPNPAATTSSTSSPMTGSTSTPMAGSTSTSTSASQITGSNGGTLNSGVLGSMSNSGAMGLTTMGALCLAALMSFF